MKSTLLLSFLCLALLAPTGLTQDSGAEEELGFVQKLRHRGQADLALEYLDTRLRANPQFAVILPLELAATRLELAENEPDAVRRLDQFSKARAELDGFLSKNPTHPRAGDARFQIANVSLLQGKTQLTRALALPEEDTSRPAELLKARSLFGDARKNLEKTVALLNTAEARDKADVEVGQLLIAQASTYADEKEDAERAKVLKEAFERLDKVATKLDTTNPLRWVALAWAGRARAMNGEAREAQRLFRQITGSKAAAATQSKRMASYFDLLNDHEMLSERGNPDAKDITTLLDKGTDWLKQYPNFKTTSEGFGVQYILARRYFDLGAVTKDLQQQNGHFASARNYIRALELTDNEFTTRAQQTKIDILVEQKAFTRNLLELASFDDCYMRALYEHQQLNKNPKKFEKPEDLEKQRRLVVSALERAMIFHRSRPLSVPETDLGNATFMLTGYQLTMKQYVKAADAGEAFIRSKPRARQASTTALFVAQALLQAIKDGAEDDFDKMQSERKRLYELGQFMSDRWPGERAGSLGRFLIVDYLLKKPLVATDPEERKQERQVREREALRLAGDFARLEIGRQRAKESDFLSALKMLREIKADFENYGFAQYQLALAALQLEANYAQLKQLEDPKDADFQQLDKILQEAKRPSFKQLSIEALERIPDPPADADPDRNLVYIRAKTQLGFLYYSLNQFDAMEALSKKLQARLPEMEFPAGVDKKNFEPALAKMKLFSLYGRADVDYRANKFAEVATYLAPFIKEASEGKYDELKEDSRLFSGLLGLAFRSNLQAQRLKDAMSVIEIWRKVEKDPELVPNILKQTIATMRKQVDDLRKQKDMDRLTKTAEGLSYFLDEVPKLVEKDKQGIDFAVLLAQGYSSVGKHSRAVEMLEKQPAPKPMPPNKPLEDKEEPLRRLARVLLIREHRLAGTEGNDEAELKKAEQLMEEIMGSRQMPGWGRADLNALVEEVYLFTQLKYHGAAVNRADALIKLLLPKLNQGTAWRDRYFEAYYLFVLSYYRYGLAQDKPDAQQASIQKAAQALHKLVETHADLGGPESKDRFERLLSGEDGKTLLEAYTKLNGKWPL